MTSLTTGGKFTKAMELHRYQKRIANHIASHPRCILSVDMGLGKTASVLAWLDWARRTGRVRSALIVAPKRVAENNWKQEMAKWGYFSMRDDTVIVMGEKKARRAILEQKKPIVVISRDNLKDLEPDYMSWDAVILDELTSFKSVEAARTKHVMALHASWKIGLTGTFLANGAVDIYGQAAACGLGDSWGGGGFFGWRGHYFTDVMKGSGQKFSKWKLKVGLPDLLAPIAPEVFTLTAGDYLEIPPVSHNHHPIEVSGEVREAINELNSFLVMSLNGQILTFNERQKFAKLQTLVNGFVYTGEDGEAVRGRHSAKLEAVADFVADCKEAGEPVLLFYAFREEAIWLAELLRARGVKVESVNSKGFMERWNAGEIECLFAHPASAGHGLNLQHGGRVIVWSTLTYNYEYYAQANARLARQGQTKNVQIHYFFGAETVEGNILKALERKADEQGQFLTLTKQ